MLGDTSCNMKGSGLAISGFRVWVMTMQFLGKVDSFTNLKHILLGLFSR